MEGLQEIIADDFVGKGSTIELSKQQTIDYFQILFTAFPDYSFGLSDFEEKEDLIYCTSHEKGTHDGVFDLNPFMPLSLLPTGKSFNLPKGVFKLRVKDDQVIYLNEEVEEGGGLAGILEQLGVELA